MSWAGKISGLFERLRSLLPARKQAPSFSMPSSGNDSSTHPDSNEGKDRIAAAVSRWEKDRRYLMPENDSSRCAEQMGISSQDLYRYCLDVFGMDFRSWRTSLRITEAKRLLLEYPDESLSNIGRRVGINDRSNFARLFKQVTGVSPSDWRRKHQPSKKPST